MGVDSAPGTRRHHARLGPHGRRIGDGWDAGSRRVLIGLVDAEAAGRLAKMFEASAALPTLVFSCEHLVREAREEAYGLIVLDSRFACAHDLRCLREVREASPTPIMTVGEADEGSAEILEMTLDPIGTLARSSAAAPP